MVDRKKKAAKVNISILVLLLYFFSVITTFVYIELFDIQNIAYNNELIPYALLFCLFIILFFWPLIRYDEEKSRCLILPSQKILDIFSMFVVVISIVSIIYFLPIAITIFSTTNLSDAREMATQDGNQFIQVGLLNTIASTAASFYNIALILSFIYLSIGKRKGLAILLFISSFSYVLNVFAYAGRDGVIFWTFSFLVTYMFFKDYLPHKIQKRLKQAFLIFLCVGIILFLAISSDRFGNAMIKSFVSYYGQQYINFCFYCQEGFYYTPGYDFPLFREILGLPKLLRGVWEVGNSSSWTWGTLFRSFLENFGLTGSIILGFIISIIINVIINNGKKSTKFSVLFVLFLYLQVLMQGVFYFAQNDRGANLFIIVSFVLYFIFNAYCSQSKNYIVKCQ